METWISWGIEIGSGNVCEKGEDVLGP